MWRPVEIFLYDWWPEVGKRRLFNRLASMPMEVSVNVDVPVAEQGLQQRPGTEEREQNAAHRS